MQASPPGQAGTTGRPFLFGCLDSPGAGRSQSPSSDLPADLGGRTPASAIPSPLPPEPHPYLDARQAAEADLFNFVCSAFGLMLASIKGSELKWLWIPCKNRQHPRCKIINDEELAVAICKIFYQLPIHMGLIEEDSLPSLRRRLQRADAIAVIVPAPDVRRMAPDGRRLRRRVRTVFSTVPIHVAATDFWVQLRGSDQHIYRATALRPVDLRNGVGGMGRPRNKARRTVCVNATLTQVRGPKLYLKVPGVKYDTFHRLASQHPLHRFSLPFGHTGEECYVGSNDEVVRLSLAMGADPALFGILPPQMDMFNFDADLHEQPANIAPDDALTQVEYEEAFLDAAF